MIQLMEENELQ